MKDFSPNIFSKSRVLVVGDLILDLYHEGHILGVSAETPTLIVKAERDLASWGGAGFLARNILALGGKLTLISVIGTDDFSKNLNSFQHQNLAKVFFREAGRKATVKERFWSADHKLLGWDRLDNRPISRKTEKAIASFVAKNLSVFDKLIVSDYRHGLLSESLARTLTSLAKKARKPIYVDSQVSQLKSNHLWYRGASLFALNKKEALSIDPDFDDRHLKASLEKLARKLNTRAVVLKMGEEGSVSFVGGSFISSKALEVKVVDTVGAGDAFFAALSLLSPKLSSREFVVANAWAGLKTALWGTIPPTLASLEKVLVK